MSQSTLDIANQSRTNFRIAVNAALQALASQSSGNTAPSELYPFMPWADTSSNKLKMRDSTNTSWIEVGDLDVENLGLLPKAGGAMAGVLQLDASADIASGATVDLASATGNDVTITHSSDTTATTSFGAASSLQKGTRIRCRASISGGTYLLTYNATSMKLPGSANITVADGDSWDAVKISDSNAYWQVENYTRKNGTALSALDVGKIQDIDASVSGNALTITINPTTLDFRSTTLTDGTPETVTLASAAIVVVPNTATLGTANSRSARLAVLAINNAGTIEAAVVNLAGGNQLDETNLISTTAVSTGADSANVIYSTTARSNVAYRVLGFIDITETTAGTWATAPTLVQGAGGNAITALSSLGYGQTWQDVSGSRAAVTTYYNTTGKPIVVSVGATISSTRQFEVDGLTVGYFQAAAAAGYAVAIVPPGSSYRINGSVSTIIYWSELR